MLKIIVAMDQHRGIGIHNRLPWSIKEDLKQFKKETLGHSVLMGRKTLDSIGHALSDRTNFVVSRQKSLSYENVTVVSDIQAFLVQKQNSEDTVYVIGGASLYALAMEFVSELIISEVKGIYDCDTFFPPFDLTRFDLIETLEFEEFTRKRFVRKSA